MQSVWLFQSMWYMNAVLRMEGWVVTFVSPLYEKKLITTMYYRMNII
jgi:hypothetical protein